MPEDCVDATEHRPRLIDPVIWDEAIEIHDVVATVEEQIERREEPDDDLEEDVERRLCDLTHLSGLRCAVDLRLQAAGEDCLLLLVPRIVHCDDVHTRASQD